MRTSSWLVRASDSPAVLRRTFADRSVRWRPYRRQRDLCAVTLRHEDYLTLSSTRPDLQFFPDAILKPFAGPTTRITPAFFNLFRRRSGVPGPGLNEVLDLIAAPDAWNRSCGDDTYVAVIDSGIHGPHPEFPAWKRADGQSSDGSDPWDDPLGHGTMVAAIAAAAPATGARCSGVAPGAKLYSCKIALTQEGYETSAIIDAYEWIEDRREEHGHPIIVNNSFGFQTDSAPLVNGVPVTDQHPIVAAIRRLVRAGIPVVFAAGNNHDRSRCHNSLPPACAPDTIWAWNSLPEVMAVAEASDRLRPTPFSSRGPGQWAPADHPKPDCAAPTFGWILFGPSYRDTVDGWGTSGAAPQVAGLLALLASRDPGKAPRDYYDRVRATCTPVKACRRCVGHGLIHCGRAVQ